MKMRPTTFLRLAVLCTLLGLQAFVYGKSSFFAQDTLPNPTTPNFEGVGWYIATPNAIIQNTTVKEKEVAMWVNYPVTGNDPQPEIINNTFQINDFGIYIESGDPYIRYNSLGNNQAYGAFNEPTNILVNVCENWWGHQTGPRHLTNPNGLGSPASDNLVFEDCFLTSVPNRKRLDLKLFLQGPYAGNGMMTTELNDKMIIPFVNPYYTVPWNHTENVEAIPMPAEVTDWILLSLRTTAAPSTTVETKAVLLRNDGVVVSPDGRDLYFNQGPGQDSLYVVAYHRNHVGVMSQNPIQVSNNVLSYDFSLYPTFGGVLGKADLGDGRFGLLAGDYDANGQIQNTDYNNLLLHLGISGYHPGDLNLNTQVQNTDIQNYLTPNIGRGAGFLYSY